MPRREQYPRLGAAIERAYADTLTDWLEQHRGRRDAIHAAVEEITEVHLEAFLRPQARSLVVVSIDARRGHMSMTDAFELQQTPFNAYRQVVLGLT